MSRKPREYHSGCIYHITHRGHNHQYILADDLDKATFLEKLKVILREHSGQLLYYVLMNNHYHFLLEMQTAPIDRIMHRLHTSYGRFYAHKYQTTGAVFENRYHAQEIDTSKYLQSVIKYIALNPIRAGLTEKVNEYRWSAHLEIGQRQSTYINKSRLFERLSPTPERGRSLYYELIQTAQKEPLTKPDPAEFRLKRKTSDLENQLKTLLSATESLLTLQEILSSKRTSECIRIRQAFAREALAKGYSINEIAATLKVSTRSIRYWSQN